MKRAFIGLVLLQLVFAACNKEPVYQPDPADAPSTTPLVSVLYDPGALGDMTYNDLLYEGVERAAFEAGIRTDQYSPRNKEEGLTYLARLFDQMSNPADTTRHLLIVAGLSYDAFVRANNRRLEANPRAELLYFETKKPLEGKGASIHVSMYGVMYMTGVTSSGQVLIVAANPYDVAESVAGFQAGFGGTLFMEYLSDQPGSGYAIRDEDALHMMYSIDWDPYRSRSIVPLCGGAGAVFRRLAEDDDRFYYVGVDQVIRSMACYYTAVKHTDRAVEHCIRQWLSDEGLPKQQTLGLADGYTELVFCPVLDYLLEQFDILYPEEQREALRQEAIEKEEAYEGR